MDIEKIGINLGHLFRFGFVGGLGLLVAAILYPAKIISLQNSLGWPLTIYAALSFEALIYAIYRPLFLELLLVRFRFYLHAFYDWLWSKIRKNGKKRTSGFLYIKDLGVSKRDVVFAYRAIRDGFLSNKSPQRVLEIREANALNHYIYLTGVVALLGGITSSYELFGDIGKPFSTRVWFLLSAFFFATGLISDINLDKTICDFIQDYDESEIKTHLQKHGYLKN